MIVASGSRLAIFGLGRSGLGIAQAAMRLGMEPIVYDETPAEKLSKPELLSEARGAGLEVVVGWEGRFCDVSAVVVNPAVPKKHPKLLEAVAAGISVIGEIEFAYQISKAPIVAITGTNGKSTTTVMTYLCLKACGLDAVLCGNIFGSGYDEVTMTDAALNSTADQILVAEVSSFQLEWIKEFRPISAGITNIWPDHLDRYDSFEEYAATKQKLFSNMRADDFTVVRANDPVVTAPGLAGSGYRPRNRRGPSSITQQDTPTALTFGATGEHGRVEERDLMLLDKRVPLDSLPFDEAHNYQNACMASLLAYGALSHLRGLGKTVATELLTRAEREHWDLHKPRFARPGETPPEPRVMPMEVIGGLRQFKGLAHRMERLGEKAGVRVINNSMCTNPDAVIKSVQAVKDPTHILMGGVNKGLDFGPLRHYLANHRHHAYLFGRDAEELNTMLGGGFPVFASMQEAFKSACENATKREVIMLAPGCASTDSFRDFRDRGNVFKAIATDWLRS